MYPDWENTDERNMVFFLRTVQYFLALLPALLLCWYIYRLDKYEKEDFLPLAIHFILGFGVAFAAYFLERSADEWGLNNPGNFWASFFFAFVIVAGVEELAKFLPLVSYTFTGRFFDEPMDGIVYGVFIAMGFASFENLVYAYEHEIDTTLVRAFTAVPAHAAFGVIQGYYAGMGRFGGYEKKYLRLAKGLFIAFFIHGLYDFFLLYEWYDWLVLLALVVLGLSLYYARRLVTLQQERSPFKPPG